MGLLSSLFGDDSSAKADVKVFSYPLQPLDLWWRRDFCVWVNAEPSTYKDAAELQDKLRAAYKAFCDSYGKKVGFSKLTFAIMPADDAVMRKQDLPCDKSRFRDVVQSLVGCLAMVSETRQQDEPGALHARFLFIHKGVALHALSSRMKKTMA